MATSRISTSSILQGFPKSRSLLAGNTAYSPVSLLGYNSIQTITVGSGGTATVDFTSIPSIYKHLQIRAMFGTSSAGSSTGLKFNNNSTGTKYAYHYIAGTGSGSGFTGESINRNFLNITDFTGGSLTASPTVAIIDVLDYASATKNKTLQNLSGYDASGSGGLGIFSGHWRDTTAINQITIYSISSATFLENSSFALYGIEG